MKPFGKLKDGKACHLYVLENDKFKVEMTDYGASLVSFIDKKTGLDIVQGYLDVDGYVNNTPYMGATIGRVCNRIGNAEFTLNEEVYHLNDNDRGNTLHGGINSFSTKVFNTTSYDNKLVFSYLSKDLEEGFPGDLDLRAIYSLTDEGLVFTWLVNSTKDTIVSITNHAFFNLNGPTSNSALDLELKINSDYFTPIDDTGLTLDLINEVKNTPFDFRTFKKVGKDINEDNLQLKLGRGYDHNYLINGTGLREHAVLRSDKLVLTIISDMPALQLYSGNFLDGNGKGKENGTFPYRSAICLETQYVPNSINSTNFEKPILLAGETLNKTTIFKLEER